jgi:hypothetical protein
VTPFELSLENELNVEWQRFANDWLFKWHGMTYEGGVTDVDDFRGGRIHYAGIKFGYQQQQIFWQAIDRYLTQKVHETFRRWNVETEAYPGQIRLTSLDGVERCLRRFTSKILGHAVDTDRRLRGEGYPESAPQYNSSGSSSRAEVEIARLSHAHRALLEEQERNERAPSVPLSRRQQLETFLSRNKGILALIGILVAVVFGVLKFVF